MITKKANMNFLWTFIIGFIGVGLLITMALSLLSDNQADLSVDTAAYNASVDVMDGVETLSSKLPMIAGVIGIVIIIGYLSYLKQK